MAPMTKYLAKVYHRVPGRFDPAVTVINDRALARGSGASRHLASESSLRSSWILLYPTYCLVSVYLIGIDCIYSKIQCTIHVF